MGNNASSTLTTIYKASPVGMAHDGVQGKRPEATTGEFWEGSTPSSNLSPTSSPMDMIKGESSPGEAITDTLGGNSETNFLSQFSSVLQGQSNSNAFTKSLFDQQSMLGNAQFSNTNNLISSLFNQQNLMQNAQMEGLLANQIQSDNMISQLFNQQDNKFSQMFNQQNMLQQNNLSSILQGQNEQTNLLGSLMNQQSSNLLSSVKEETFGIKEQISGLSSQQGFLASGIGDVKS